MKEGALKAEVSKMAKTDGRGDPASMIHALSDRGILQLGVEIQCPICTQRSWYSVKEADYELHCYKCLERFRLPPSTKEIKWAYRSAGPFSLPNYAFGAYPILFVLNFLERSHVDRKTPHLSFTATRGPDSFEIDLGVLFHDRSSDSREIRLMFGEGKTYAHFKSADVTRLRKFAASFPGAILLFATLRTTLTNEEKRLFRAAVKRNREIADRWKPFNPIMILTGKELLSDFGAPLCWERSGETDLTRNYYARDKTFLSLCDITQQLYLDMKSWDGIMEARW